MAEHKLDKTRPHIRVSSSIANWREKLINRTKAQEWHWWRSRKRPTVFFGMYHWGDYWRLLWHRGERRVFWCGSDTLRIPWWMRYISATHYAETESERFLLNQKGISPLMCPMIFANPEKYRYYSGSYIRVSSPRVYLTCQEGREEEYGLPIVERMAQRFPYVDFHIFGNVKNFYGVFLRNIRYYGPLTELEFDRGTSSFQASLRLNKVDGMAETTAKSLIRGHYAIVLSTHSIPYVMTITNDDELVEALKLITGFQKKGNIGASDYWLKRFEESLQEIMHEA